MGVRGTAPSSSALSRGAVLRLQWWVAALSFLERAGELGGACGGSWGGFFGIFISVC